MISLSGLGKVYNMGEPNEVIALQNTDLTINRGDFLVIIGSNGSGKSTLLNLLSGSVSPTAGTITINAGEISYIPEYKRSKWIARVFQDPLKGTATDLSILDNFRMAALRTRSKGLTIGHSARFEKLVKEKVGLLGMGLENKLDQLVGDLSGGQRQALTLLMCVMDDLEILLLDEPTAALDPKSAALLMKLADRLVAELQLTAVLVTHHLKDAFTYGNRLIFMEEGAIRKDLDHAEKMTLAEIDLYSWFM